MTVHDIADLHRMWCGLMGEPGFARRTLWLALVKPDGSVAPVLMPIDDLPRTPVPRFAASLQTIFSQLAELEGGAAPALLLTRPGNSAVRDDDRAWARMLAELAPRWPVTLGTDESIAVLSADDLEG